MALRCSQSSRDAPGRDSNLRPADWKISRTRCGQLRSDELRAPGCSGAECLDLSRQLLNDRSTARSEALRPNGGEPGAASLSYEERSAGPACCSRLRSLRSSQLTAWIESEFEEVPGPHRGGSLWRELFRVYRGRFCFRLGAGVRCGAPISYTIAAGETQTLQLSVQLGLGGHLSLGGSGTIEYTHTFAQEIGPWPLPGCDSIFPVFCFDDAELRQFRWRRAIRRYELAGFIEEFDAHGDPGYAAPNYLRNDPFCDGHDPDEPTTVDPSPQPTSERFPLTVVARPAAFLPRLDSDGRREDPEAAVDEVAQLLTDIFTSDEGKSLSADQAVIGFARSDGVVIWLNRPPSLGSPTLGLVPWGLASVVRMQITLDRDIVPLLAVGPPSEAAQCDLLLLAQLPGTDELQEVAREQATVRVSDQFTVVWYEANLAELENGTSGIIDLQLRDASGAAIGYPVRESFTVDSLPAVQAPVPV